MMVCSKVNKKNYNFPIYRKGSGETTKTGLKNIDNRQMGGTHWTCFYIKHNRSIFFDSFGGQPDTFLPNQLPESIIYQNHEIQDIKSRLRGTYCFQFFYLILQRCIKKLFRKSKCRKMVTILASLRKEIKFLIPFSCKNPLYELIVLKLK